MSYVVKKGKTSAYNRMVTRQQISDVLVYGSIQTTLTKAKTTQVYLEKLITLAKKNSLDAKRRAAGILLNTKDATAKEILKKLFSEIRVKYEHRNGGYSRVLKLGKRSGDNAEIAVLQLV